MGNGIYGNGDWHPPLKLDSSNIVEPWRNFCLSIADPIMSMTLWQGGPPTWLIGGGNINLPTSNNSVWNMYQNNGVQPWANRDAFVPSTTIPYAPSSTSEDVNLTPEERDAEEFKKEQLKKKIDKLKTILNDFKDTLDRNVESDFLLIKKIERATGNSSITQEQLDELKKIYDDNNLSENVKTKFLETISVSQDEDFVKNVNKDCWMNENWVAQTRITEDNVLQYIITFDSISRKGQVGSGIIEKLRLQKEYFSEKNKGAVVAHVKSIQTNLVSLAEKLYNDKSLGETTKQSLQNAINKIKNCVPEQNLCVSNEDTYEKNLLALCEQIKKAKTEIFEKEHEFLGLKFDEA